MENGLENANNVLRLVVKTGETKEQDIFIKSRDEECYKQHEIVEVSFKDDNPDGTQDTHVVYDRESILKVGDQIVAVDEVSIVNDDLDFLKQLLKNELHEFRQEEYSFIIRRRRHKDDSIKWDYFEIKVRVFIGRGGEDDVHLHISNLRNLTLSLLDLSTVTGVQFNEHATEHKKVFFPMEQSYVKVTGSPRDRRIELGRLSTEKDASYEFKIYTFRVTGVRYSTSDTDPENLSSVYVLQNTSSKCYIESRAKNKSLGLKSSYDAKSYRDWKTADSRFFIIVKMEDDSCYFESVRNRGLFIAFADGRLKMRGKKEISWEEKAYPPECVLFKCFPY